MLMFLSYFSKSNKIRVYIFPTTLEVRCRFKPLSLPWSCQQWNGHLSMLRPRTRWLHACTPSSRNYPYSIHRRICPRCLEPMPRRNTLFPPRSDPFPIQRLQICSWSRWGKIWSSSIGHNWGNWGSRLQVPTTSRSTRGHRKKQDNRRYMLPLSVLESVPKLPF